MAYCHTPFSRSSKITRIELTPNSISTDRRELELQCCQTGIFPFPTPCSAQNGLKVRLVGFFDFQRLVIEAALQIAAITDRETRELPGTCLVINITCLGVTQSSVDTLDKS